MTNIFINILNFLAKVKKVNPFCVSDCSDATKPVNKMLRNIDKVKEAKAEAVANLAELKLEIDSKIEAAQSEVEKANNFAKNFKSLFEEK